MLLTENLSAFKHTGIRSFFNRHFFKGNLLSKEASRLYNNLFETRRESDYHDFVVMKEKDVRSWPDETEDFLKEIQNVIDTK